MQTLQSKIAVFGANGTANQSCVNQYNTNCISLHLLQPHQLTTALVAVKGLLDQSVARGVEKSAKGR